MTTKYAADHALEDTLRALPRRRLAALPTPLDPLEKLSDMLGIQLSVKRDDLTGLGMGGNKVRKLEYVIADALAQGADTVITWAGVQSNWCRQTAAAARKCGLNPILVLFRRPGLPAAIDGNLLLDRLLGADVRLVDLGERPMMEFEGVRDIIEEVAEGVRKAGHKPYIAPIGASLTCGSMTRPLGAVAYAQAMSELLQQAGRAPGSIVLATGSGSMQAGLLAGARLLCPGARVVGISVGDDAQTMRKWVQDIAAETMSFFYPHGGAPGIRGEDVIVFDEYAGSGYGVLERPASETIRLAGETEGLLLDPVYTAKAFTGLVDLVYKGYFRRGEDVIFVHSGGTPALFVYREKLLEHLDRQART
jgi:D-cysteine desulfhydrase family pyridoxal phosphate-dependent enzyme